MTAFRALLLFLCAGCGLESLFQGSDYERTPAPRVVLTFQAPGADTVELHDATGALVASVPAAAGEIDLGEERDWPALRVVVRRSGGVAARALVAEAVRAAEPIDLGLLDEVAGAAAILAEARLELDGLELAGAPAPIVAELLLQARGEDPALAALRDQVRQAGADGLLPVAGTSVDRVGWDAALAAAVGKIGVPIVCDPAFVRVLFAVDLSGQGLDGNGQRQLIRQPPKEGRVFLGFTVDDSSPIADSARQLPARLTPNDPAYAMGDDGAAGDEVAGDGIYSRALVLPRGMRILYKYTDGSAGESFTRTEEWPGNARILAVEDVVTRHGDGRPDCLVVRRDSFGDEASNKNSTSLAEKLRPLAGTLGWETDLGGPEAAPAEGRFVGGLDRLDPRSRPPLTPDGVPEARENGVCTRCPPPLVLAPGDRVAPRLLSATFVSTTEIEVRFSEAMAVLPARDPSAWVVVDSALRALPVRAVAPAGDRVRLTVEGPDFGDRYSLVVRRLPDASVAQNPLEGPDQIAVGRDVTPPRALLARAASRKDVEPSASLPDPTVGEVVFVTFSEAVDRASAEDVSHYRVESIFGEPLSVRGAFLRGPAQVALVTDTQARNRRYAVSVTGVTDFARNPVVPATPLGFDGFALYRVSFGVSPGHAFASRDGLTRGIPGNEKMFLTGTPLALARALDATDLSVPGRTDVTGVPEMLMPPGAELHAGKAIHRIELLLPPGTYAWKPAHGVSGEWTSPPPTLVKVGKALGTTLDPSGVGVDPVTLIGRDGKSYGAALLSAGGSEKPGPGVLFKRENPDEICVVKHQDVDCGVVVIGTWRDLAEFTADYDDGQPEVAPTRLGADTSPPAPIWVQVRDSESLRVTFDEAIAPGVMVSIAGLEVGELRAKFPGPHELVVRTGAQAPGRRYELVVNGLVDLAGNARTTPLIVAWTSPQSFLPFTPFEDTAAPVLLAATPESPTTLRVRFDEPLAAAAADPAKFQILARGSAPPPAVLAASLSGSGKDVILTTAPQPREAAFAVRAQGIADRATPPNVLTSATVDFVGFGDSVPPVLVQARAVAADRIALSFDEPVDGEEAMDAGSYTVAGATVTGVEFSGDPALRASMFDPKDAPLARRYVLLRTTPLAPGSAHAVTASLRDLSGNAGGGTLMVVGPASPPLVTVFLEIQVSDTQTAWGSVPARALAPARLDAEREGIFVVGVGGFPPEGSPLTGVEPQAVDDGTGGDRVAGDRVYTLAVRDVPLGTTLEWKAFAPYTVAWKNAHPQDAAAAFADATPGPSAFSDGQEYPGNENGARVIADLDGDGAVRVRTLFGDETGYKKLSRSPAFLWFAEEVAFAP